MESKPLVCGGAIKRGNGGLVEAQIDGELAAMVGEVAEDCVRDHEISRLLLNDLSVHFECPEREQMLVCC